MSIPERNQMDAPGTPLNQKGTQVFDKDGWTIRRVVLSYAYARNGNVHNPTPNVTFLIFNPADGLPSPEKVFGHKLPPIEPPAPVAPAQRPRSRSARKPRPRGSVDCSMMPLMPDKCVTCPFRSEGYDQVRENVQARSLQGVNQTCHHTGSIHGKPDTHLCRGARDFQLQIFAGMGVIDEPTDEAWDRARAKYLDLPPTPGKRKNREAGTSGSKEDSPEHP